VTLAASVDPNTATPAITDRPRITFNDFFFLGEDESPPWKDKISIFL
jgi:hypothetical protein